MRKVKHGSALRVNAVCLACLTWLTAAREARADDPGTLKPAPSPAMLRMLEPRLTWDANLEGGLGRVFSSPGQTELFARARAGLSLVRGPFYDTLGLTYEYSRLSPATFGLQAEVAHLSAGFWGQAGGMLDVKGRPGAMLSFGWAVVGVEGEVRGLDTQGPAWAVYGKLRIPLSLFILAAWKSRPPSPPVHVPNPDPGPSPP